MRAPTEPRLFQPIIGQWRSHSGKGSGLKRKYLQSCFCLPKMLVCVCVFLGVCARVCQCVWDKRRREKEMKLMWERLQEIKHCDYILIHCQMFPVMCFHFESKISRASSSHKGFSQDPSSQTLGGRGVHLRVCVSSNYFSNQET